MHFGSFCLEVFDRSTRGMKHIVTATKNEKKEARNFFFASRVEKSIPGEAFSDGTQRLGRGGGTWARRG